MTCQCGDVVVVPFPFVELDVHKPRPALVLSTKAFNETHDQIILAMITTAARSTWPSDVPIEEWASAGLARRCFVRWKVFTLPQGRLGPTIGQLARADRQQVENQRRLIFDDGT